VIRLPRALELELRDELLALEKETNMAYVMSIERWQEKKVGRSWRRPGEAGRR